MWRSAPLTTHARKERPRAPSLEGLLSLREGLITLGGVSLGGVGKTEVALWLACALSQRQERSGARVALLSHGYCGRSRSAEKVQLPPYHQLTETERRDALERWGDEAIMMSWRAPKGVEVWAGGTWDAKVQSSRALLRVCDGALYRKELKPDVQLCLFDPALKPKVFPLGELSRPLAYFPQGVWWWSHTGGDTPVRDHFSRCTPLIARSTYQHLTLITPDGESISSDHLRERVVEPWTGTARPYRFLRTLQSLGARTTQAVTTRNHRPFPKSSLRQSQELMRVCTYKDLPRIPKDLEIYVLEPSLHVTPQLTASQG